MSLQEWALVIQTASVVVAVGASLIALRIASRNRRDSLRQSHLMFELEAAVRLTQNLARGGSTDDLERKHMGAEALALAGALEKTRIPNYWRHKFESDEVLGTRMAATDTPEWQRDAIEAQLAVNAILRDIADHEGRGGGSS